jgi:hypothetical protein
MSDPAAAPAELDPAERAIQELVSPYELVRTAKRQWQDDLRGRIQDRAHLLREEIPQLSQHEAQERVRDLLNQLAYALNRFLERCEKAANWDLELLETSPSHHLSHPYRQETRDRALGFTSEGFSVIRETLIKFLKGSANCSWLKTVALEEESRMKDLVREEFVDRRTDYEARAKKITAVAAKEVGEPRVCSQMTRHEKETERQPVKRISKLGDSSTIDSTVLTIDKWENLGIGINEDGSYLAITPCPEHGSVFSVEKAVKLNLPGDQFKHIFGLLAESKYGNSTSKHDVMMKFRYLERPIREEDLEEAAKDADITRTLSSASKRLNSAIADLGRKLRAVVNCPDKNRADPALSTKDAKNVTARFNVRNLVREGDGKLHFGGSV